MRLKNYVILLLVLIIHVRCSTGSKVIQYGNMHEAIGGGKSQARVELKKFFHRPHFVGVGSLEGLLGEVTVLDGQLIVSQVGDGHRVAPVINPERKKATMLIGSSVSHWQQLHAHQDMDRQEFEQWIENSAKKNGRQREEPFICDISTHVRHLRI